MVEDADHQPDFKPDLSKGPLNRTAEHLKRYRWQPGQSGNPKGRPKRESFETIVERLLDLDHPDGDVDCSRREYIARQFIDMMECRDSSILKDFADRVWPKLTKHEIAGRDGEPVEFRQLIEIARQEQKAKDEEASDEPS